MSLLSFINYSYKFGPYFYYLLTFLYFEIHIIRHRIRKFIRIQHIVNERKKERKKGINHLFDFLAHRRPTAVCILSNIITYYSLQHIYIYITQY